MKVKVSVFAMILFGCMLATKQAESAEAQDSDLLYRAKCTACHRVYSPKKYTYQTLQAHVATYGKKLSGEERWRLLDYLKENAKQERK